MISPSKGGCQTTDGQDAPEETRYYIGLSGGLRGSMKTTGEHFDAPLFAPLGSEQWIWYQVSPEIAEEWMRDDEEGTA